MISNIRILDTEILSEYRYTLKKITFEYAKNNSAKQTQSREVYDKGNAATILLYNKSKNTVILTKQFRLPTFINGNETGMLIEACAGLLDKDTPEQCIRRETEEETGYRLKEVKQIFEAYMSPGAVTEMVTFFIAEYGEEMKVSKGGGLEEEQEYIDVLEVNIGDAITMLADGRIKDAKTIMLLQYVQLNIFSSIRSGTNSFDHYLK